MLDYAFIDSVSELCSEHRNTWVFCGSHGGLNAAKHTLSYSLAGIIFNDAGVGKGGAGIAGLDLLEREKIPAACVDCNTARIGEGLDTFQNGIISHVNSSAYSLGINPGMPCKNIVDVLKGS